MTGTGDRKAGGGTEGIGGTGERKGVGWCHILHLRGKDIVLASTDADRQQVFHAQLVSQDVKSEHHILGVRKEGEREGAGGFFHMVKVLIKINCKLC